MSQVTPVRAKVMRASPPNGRVLIAPTSLEGPVPQILIRCIIKKRGDPLFFKEPTQLR
jgi:hypothetical protein